MSLQAPTKLSRKAIRDVARGVALLGCVLLAAVAVGLVLSEHQRENWGQWLGAFIAGIALVASAYAIFIQARQGESASWNIALGRLGEIYDQAYANHRLASIICQPCDSAGKIEIDPDDVELSSGDIVWLGSLFLAFEQIFVATGALSQESRRVWQLYLLNQLNKPFIRAAFVKDACDAKDYHQDFWRFVRGKKERGEYKGAAIDPKYFRKADHKKSIEALSEPLVSRPFQQEHSDFWMELYGDQEVRKQMYAAPLDRLWAANNGAC